MPKRWPRPTVSSSARRAVRPRGSALGHSSVVVAGLGAGRAGLSKLQGRVFDADVEVLGDAVLQLIEQGGDESVEEALVLDDDIGGEHG